MPWFSNSDKKQPDKKGGFNRSKGYDHNPDDVYSTQTVFGTCSACRQKGEATQITYWSGEILIRCNKCKKANQFTIAAENFNNPKLYPPARGEGDDSPNSNEGGRYTKGKR